MCLSLANGVQGQSSRPVCNRPGYCYPIKNLYMKQCEFYKPANEQQLKILRELGRR
jgi:hypothetical protein